MVCRYIAVIAGLSIATIPTHASAFESELEIDLLAGFRQDNVFDGFSDFDHTIAPFGGRMRLYLSLSDSFAISAEWGGGGAYGLPVPSDEVNGAVGNLLLGAHFQSTTRMLRYRVGLEAGIPTARIEDFGSRFALSGLNSVRGLVDTPLFEYQTGSVSVPARVEWKLGRRSPFVATVEARLSVLIHEVPPEELGRVRISSGDFANEFTRPSYYQSEVEPMFSTRLDIAYRSPGFATGLGAQVVVTPDRRSAGSFHSRPGVGSPARE